MRAYDLAVVGTGLAGALAAVTTAEAGLNVLVLERGHGPGDRRNLANGWLGCALYTMARLDVGSADSGILFDMALDLCREANGGNLEHHQGEYALPDDLPLRMSPKPHYRTKAECGRELAQCLHRRLLASGNANTMFGTEVERIERDGDGFLIHTRRGRQSAQRCLVATGSHSSGWIRSLFASVGLETDAPCARLGIRIEVPSRLLRTFLRVADDLRLYGEGVLLDDARIGSAVGDREGEGLLSAFAHNLPGQDSRRTNLMASLDPEMDLGEATRLAKIANILSNDKVRHERAEDFADGRSVLRHIGQFDPLRDALRSLDRMVPSLLGCAIVHIPEMRISGALPAGRDMRTAFPGLYGAGECVSGVDGLLDAMVSALASARSIVEDANG
jgi:hypothetical protein